MVTEKSDRPLFESQLCYLQLCNLWLTSLTLSLLTPKTEIKISILQGCYNIELNVYKSFSNKNMQ